MATNFHFYTEIDLFSQVGVPQYGPSSSNPTTNYLVTSQFTTNGGSGPARAFAVCDGTIFVQPVAGSSTLVNLILRPHVSDLENGFTPVSYFIYRGLLLQNFATGANYDIIPLSDPNSTDLTNNIWNDYNSQKSLDSSITSTEPSNSSMGFNQIGQPDTTLLDSIFYGANLAFQLAHVSMGDFIGNFSGTTVQPAGFEIVLKDKLYLPTLGIVRAANNVVIAPTPSGTMPGNLPIQEMRDREVILNYIDPAAYLTILYQAGITVKLSNGNSNDYFGVNDIYNNVVSNFQTKNTLYIDIRNENGYSLNYYKDNMGQTSDSDYGDQFQYSFGDAGSNPPQSTVYYENFWPIFPIIPPSNNTTGYNTLNITFRNLYNPSPLIYVDYCQLLDNSGNLYLPVNTSKFLDENLVNPTPISWSNIYNFYVPNISLLSGNTQPAWYVKLYDVRKTNPTSVSLPNTVVPRTNYMDNAFGPIVQLPNDFGTGITQWVANTGKRYIDNSVQSGIVGFFETGIGFSTNDVLFYTNLIDQYNPEKNQYNVGSFVQPLYTGSGSSSEPTFIESLQNGQLVNIDAAIINKEPYSISSQPYFIHNIDSDNPLAPSASNYNSFALTLSEYTNVLSSITNLDSNFHEPLLQFNSYNPLLDENGNKLQEVDLNVAGFDSTGIFSKIPISVNIKTLNAVRFNSDSLGTAANLPANTEDLPIPMTLLLIGVQSVEHAYTVPLIFGGVIPDATPDKVVTRIRVHYYGSPGSGLQAIAFNKAVPYAPYLEQIPYQGNSCTSILIPPSAGFFINLPLSCRIRRLYNNYPFQSKNYEEIDSLNFKNMTSKSHLVKDPGANIVDYGHAFYGLCALLHPGPPSNINPDPPFDGKPDPIYISNLNILHSVDFTSYIGDLAQVLGEAIIDQVNNGGSESNPVGNGRLDYMYSVFLGDPDLYGDIDIFGLKKAWTYVSSVQSNFKFSDVLAHYYSSTVPVEPGPPHTVNHYSKRFTLFCQSNGFLNSNNKFILDKSDPTNFDNAAYQKIIQRISTFAVFYYNAKQYKETRGKDIGKALTANFSTFLVNTSTWFKGFDNGNLNRVLDTFATRVQLELNLE
jgi:hypothetical protein